MKNDLQKEVSIEEENIQIDMIDLEIAQLHYSAKAIEYIKVKKKSDIELVRSKIHKCDNQKYILSVYYYHTIDGINTYHVYGQEEGSDNAFILGALLDDTSIRDKISIKGVLHPEKSDQEKDNIELSNLHGMFGGEFIFKRQQKTGEVVPLFTLDGMIAKSEIKTTYKQTVYKPLDKSVPDDYIENLKKKYEKYGYHDAKCPKGSPFCVHFCNDYDKITNKCTFKCPFDREDKCDTECQYYINSRLLNCLYTKIKDRPKNYQIGAI